MAKSEPMSDTKGPGKPTKYKSEYCEQLIEHMSKGLSYESFAGTAGVHRSVLYDWEDTYPEWKDAKETAFSKCLLFWERLGIDNILNVSESFGKEGGTSKSLNGSVWIFNMKNRFKWRDKQPDEIDTVVNNNNSNVQNLSDTDLDLKLKDLMTKLNGKNEP